MDTQDTGNTPSNRQRLILGGAALVAALVIAGAIILSIPPNPVPRQVREAVSFPVFYPPPNRLPDGFALEAGSFRLAEKGVVVFSISHTGGQHLIISEEQQPGSSTVNDFLKTYLPVHSAVSTSLGQAQIGAFGKAPDIRNVLSLTVNQGPWIIITAPADTGPDQLKDIIQAFRK